MHKIKLGVLCAAAITATGCSSTKEQIKPIVNNIPKPHVEWPAPLQPCTYDFKFSTDAKGSPIVIIPYSSWVAKSRCEELEYSYIEKMIIMTCFYRTDIKDPRCSKYYGDTK